MEEFNRELEELEQNGWTENGSIACPNVGGDHDAVLYVNENHPNEDRTVCRICGVIS